MVTVIALRGKGNSGKSETINILHGLLLQNGYERVRSNIDTAPTMFVAVFRKGGKVIGLTAAGDIYDYLRRRLNELVNDGCTICVCACRTYDRGPQGTNAAIREFTNNSQYIEKEIDDNPRTQTATNRGDARKLFDVIENLI